MSDQAPRGCSLREIELEVEAEGREWTRRRLEERLQLEAERDGQVFPLSGRKARHRRTEWMGLRTGVGVLKVRIWYGLDPGTGRWGCPMRQRWGLGPHQGMSPGLEDKGALMVTVTGSYEAAAALAQKWKCEVDDSTLHALTRRLGRRAERQTQERLASVAAEQTPQRAASKLAVFMLDGYLARYRGPGWGKRKTKKKRVEWHEIKTEVFYLQAARTEGGRGANRTYQILPPAGHGVRMSLQLAAR